ncbi:desulfoferrodoxin family protein [Anaerosinus sp.]|uniref:desulfoferrodoxin family protein n=1 Tax=Selenobaculum sp. TaxID=3074374 RepID=UPI0015AA7E2E
MARDLKIYRCLDCGYVVDVIDFGKRQVITKGTSFAKTTTIADAVLVCCSKEMELLVPNTTEASSEKHLPTVEFIEGGKISVKVAHPMIEGHYIKWIAVVSGDRVERLELEPDQAPEVTFYVGDEIDVDVYAYCNLHNLWKTNIKK